RAQRHVQRVVDAAKPEPARDLRVHTRVTRQFVGGDQARRDAIGVGRSWLGDERRAVVVVAEDTVEDLRLVFVEVVEAQTAGHAERRAQWHGGFAEKRVLIEVVVQVGPEQAVLGGAKALGRNTGGGRKT